MWVQSLGGEDALQEERATHSSILAWKIPWTEEPGGLQSMGLQKRHDWVTEHTHKAHCFKTHLFVSEHLGCLWIVSILNNAGNEYEGADIASISWFQLFWVCAQRWDCWIIWWSHFYSFVEPPYCFQSGCTDLHYTTFTLQYIPTNIVQQFPFLYITSITSFWERIQRKDGSHILTNWRDAESVGLLLQLCLWSCGSSPSCSCSMMSMGTSPSK